MTTVELHNFLVKSNCCFSEVAHKAITQFSQGNITTGRCLLDKATTLYHSIYAIHEEPEDCGFEGMQFISGISDTSGGVIVAVFSPNSQNLNDYSYTWYYKDVGTEPWVLLPNEHSFFIDLGDISSTPTDVRVEILCGTNFCSDLTLIAEDVDLIINEFPTNLFPTFIIGTETTPPTLSPLLSPNYSIHNITFDNVVAGSQTWMFYYAYDFNTDGLVLKSTGKYTVFIGSPEASFSIQASPSELTLVHLVKVIPVVTPNPVNICADSTQLLTATIGFTQYQWFKDGVSLGAPVGSNTKTVSQIGSYTVNAFMNLTGLTTPSLPVPLTHKPIVTQAIRVFNNTNITILGTSTPSGGGSTRYDYIITGPEEVSTGIGTGGYPNYNLKFGGVIGLVSLAPDAAVNYLWNTFTNLNYETIYSDGQYIVGFNHPTSNCAGSRGINVDTIYYNALPILSKTACTPDLITLTITNIATLITAGATFAITDTNLVQGPGFDPLTGVFEFYNIATWPGGHPSLPIESGITDGQSVLVIIGDSEQWYSLPEYIVLDFC